MDAPGRNAALREFIARDARRRQNSAFRFLRRMAIMLHERRQSASFDTATEQDEVEMERETGGR
jgi:hypothetical protein